MIRIRALSLAAGALPASPHYENTAYKKGIRP